MQQRILIILNVVLLAAVAWLFIDRYTGKGNSGAPAVSASGSSEASGGTVYVNIDTLLNNYSAFQDRQKEITAREKEEDEKLRGRGKALEREIMALQQKAQAGTMTPKDLQREEERLARKQQEFLADQESITRRLMEESSRINDELQKEIIHVIKELKTDGSYHLVFSYGTGSPLLAADEKLDITQAVLQKLNEKAAAK